MINLHSFGEILFQNLQEAMHILKFRLFANLGQVTALVHNRSGYQ